MKNPLRLFFLLILCVIISSGSLNAATFNSQVKASTSDSERGIVCAKFATTKYSAFGAIFGSAYTHTAPSAPSSSDYKEEVTAVYNGHSGGNTACEVKIYLYAQPKEGYVFDHWVINNNEKSNYTTTEANYNFTWVHMTQTPNTATTTAVAYFRPESAVTTETNLPVALINLDLEKPQVGDNVTATFEMNRIAQSGTIGNKNMMVEFVHWENGDGTILGYEESCSFHVDKEMTIRAVFRTLGEIPRQGKYYRVRNVFNRVLAVAGKYQLNVTGAMDVDTALLRWVLPLDHNFNEFFTGRNNDEWSGSDAIDPLFVEASPSTIFYIKEGTTNSTQMTKGILEAQGVNTYDLTMNTFDVVPVAESYTGYYGITASAFSGAGLQWQVRENNVGMVNISSFKESNSNCAFAIQPIDEAHVDDFWFGAYAEEKMSHEGGYWTSMYTAFPYKLYDDGIKAYYIKSQPPTIANGESYLVLEEIEDGIVPAYSAVLLKCTEPKNTKSNRMIPIGVNDEEWDYVNSKKLDNILEGVFQLYESKPSSIRYEEKRMKNSDNIRVFSVNQNGQVGFYKLSGDNTLLKANRAYLDVDKLPAGIRSLSFKLGSTDGTTGIESVVEDGQYDRFEESKIYDLGGREVVRPAAGNIYIVNGKKVIWK